MHHGQPKRSTYSRSHLRPAPAHFRQQDHRQAISARVVHPPRVKGGPSYITLSTGTHQHHHYTAHTLSTGATRMRGYRVTQRTGYCLSRVPPLALRLGTYLPFGPTNSGPVPETNQFPKLVGQPQMVGRAAGFWPAGAVARGQGSDVGYALQGHLLRLGVRQNRTAEPGLRRAPARAKARRRRPCCSRRSAHGLHRWHSLLRVPLHGTSTGLVFMASSFKAMHMLIQEGKKCCRARALLRRVRRHVDKRE